MFMSRGFFGANGIRPNLTNRGLTDFNAGGSSARAYVILGSDGRLTLHTDNFGDTVLSAEWLTGTVTPAEAALYESVVVVNSGGLDYGSAGTFNQGIARQFGCSVPANGGTSDAAVTISIRRVSDGLVMASADFSFSVASSNA